jgi:integrase
MAAKMEKTRTPGIYKRGGRYVFSYRANGKQRWESCRTLEEARRAKAARQTDIGRGEFEERSRITLHEYAREWVDRYQGGRRGIRESTRDDYRRILNQFVLEHFPASMRITDLTPRHVAQYVGWLCEPARGLADKSVRNYVGPLSACLESARQEGVIRHNPARGTRLPHRETVEDVEHEDVRALTSNQLAVFLGVVDVRHRLFFELLAATGLRVSEAVALQWRHVQVDGDRPHVKVRRGIVRGRVGPPKTKHSRRDVPLPRSVVDGLRAHRKGTEWPGDEDLVFTNRDGGALHVGNVRRRVLKPAAEEAGAAWAGFHTFRHTCASMLFAAGRNAVQVQRWLGHHSAAFTLATYVHLLDGDLGEPLEIGANKPQTDLTPLDATPVGEDSLDLAM